MPVPLRESRVGEFEALLVKEAVADVAPVACGVKVAVNCLLCPAAIVTGKVMPVIVNSELFTFTDETVTLVPLAFSCIV